MKARRAHDADEMRDEYAFDYRTGVRGKYYKRLVKEGANVVILEPDVAKAFPSSAAVNKGLRTLMEFSEAARRLTKSARRSGSSTTRPSRRSTSR